MVDPSSPRPDGGRTEGDVNLSPHGVGGWKVTSTRRRPQSLSTPCLNVLSPCEGIYLTDAQERRLMEFHGNSMHQVGFGNPRVVEAVKRSADYLRPLMRA